MEDKIITYGGQAVIEGVMMRGQKAFAIAMRAPDGNIVVHKRESPAAVYRSRQKIPLRGTIPLWDALGLGTRALTISANTQTGGGRKSSKGPRCISRLQYRWRSGSGCSRKRSAPRERGRRCGILSRLA
ncbi:MAG: hypothetical protein U0X92_10690 [Anaerolineales bacterium]